MWIYKHECFHRDQPALLDKLRRKTSGNKNNGSNGGAGAKTTSRSSPPSPNGLTAAHFSRAGDRWSEIFDERTGHFYYYNHRTGASQWEPPHLMASPRGTGYMSGSTSSSALSSVAGGVSPRSSQHDDSDNGTNSPANEYYSYGDSPDSPSRLDQQQYAARRAPQQQQQQQQVGYSLDCDDDNIEFMEQDEQTPRGLARSPAPGTWSRQSSSSSQGGSKPVVKRAVFAGNGDRSRRWRRDASVSSFDDNMETDEEESVVDEDAGSDEEYIPPGEQRRLGSSSRRESTAQLLEGAALQMARLKEDGSISRATSSGSSPVSTSPVSGRGGAKPRVDRSIEMAPALAALALLNLPGNNDDEKLNNPDWVQLQQLLGEHPGAMSEERQLQGGRMGVAAAQLLGFCSGTYPSGRPRQLYQSLEDVLGKKHELREEFRAYRRALDPSRDTVVPAGGLECMEDAVMEEEASAGQHSQSRDNELLLLRDFMAFAVTSMQALRDLLPAGDSYPRMLDLCVATWRKTAQLYI